ERGGGGVGGGGGGGVGVGVKGGADRKTGVGGARRSSRITRIAGRDRAAEEELQRPAPGVGSLDRDVGKVGGVDRAGPDREGARAVLVVGRGRVARAVLRRRRQRRRAAAELPDREILQRGVDRPGGAGILGT